MWIQFYIIYLALLLGSRAIPVSRDGNIRLTESPLPHRGVLQVLKGKIWRMVCSNDWTYENSLVACRSLGFDNVNDTEPMKASKLRPLSSPHVFNLRCNGNEQKLNDCPVKYSSTICEPSHVVLLTCSLPQGKGVPEEIPPPMPPESLAPPESLTPPESLIPPSLEQPSIPPSLEQPLIPPIEVISTSSSGISLDWTNWYHYVITDYDPDLVIRFHILYRKTGEDSEFQKGREVPSYFTYGNIGPLEESTSYEFKIQIIRLGFTDEKSNLISPIFAASTTCSGPPRVQSVNASAANLPGTELKVSWKPSLDPKCPADSYIVDYVALSIEQCHFHSNERVVNFTTQTSYKINNLHPYSIYSISIAAKNEYGRSPTKAYVEVQTAEEAPSGPPTDIRAKFLSSKQTLRVTWNQPECGNRNGFITRYKYILLDVQTDSVKSTGETTLTFVNLHHVNPLRKYKVLVAATTKAGVGPYGAASVVGRVNIKEICGESLQTGNVRITNGDDSRKGKAPWMAQIWHIRKGKQYCAGSILNEHWVVTAAHCIVNYNITKYDIRIQVGDYDTFLPEPQQRVYDVDQIITNSEFNVDLFDNDIALIRLSEPIEFNQYIRPVCLPTKKLGRSMMKVPGSVGTVTGWGLNEKNVQPRYLQEVSLPVVERSVCKKSTNYKFTQNMFCAGYDKANLGDACVGDSGAPFTMRYNGKSYIVGIVSWGGSGCDTEDHYGFYTRVFKYIGWMRKYDNSFVIIDGS